MRANWLCQLADMQPSASCVESCNFCHTVLYFVSYFPFVSLSGEVGETGKEVDASCKSQRNFRGRPEKTAGNSTYYSVKIVYLSQICYRL